MSTSGKLALRYLVASLFCLVFSVVYESLGRGAQSIWMKLVSAWPFVLGVIPFAACALFKKEIKEGARLLYQAGVITLTVGSAIEGVLDIYGTTSVLTRMFWIMGGLLTVMGIFVGIVQFYIHKQQISKN